MKNKWMIFLMLAFFVGCTTTQKSTTAGAAAGTLLGGIIGHQSDDHGAEGAAIGAAVGALGGYVVGEKISKKKFCPTGGEQYDESVTYCPTHGTELQYVQ